MIEKKVSIYYLIDQYNRIGYVGKADDMDKRMISHKHTSINNKRYVYCWIRSVGFDNIKMVLIEECDFSIWRERERFWIAEYKKNSKLTNLTDGGDGVDGYIFSEESNKKRIESRKWYKPSDETKNKTSESCKGKNKGKVRTDEMKKNYSKARKGIKTVSCSEEKKQKISQSSKGRIPWNKGLQNCQVHSDETKGKISQSSKGRIPWNKGRCCLSNEEKILRNKAYQKKYREKNKNKI